MARALDRIGRNIWWFKMAATEPMAKSSLLQPELAPPVEPVARRIAKIARRFAAMPGAGLAISLRRGGDGVPQGRQAHRHAAALSVKRQFRDCLTDMIW